MFGLLCVSVYDDVCDIFLVVSFSFDWSGLPVLLPRVAQRRAVVPDTWHSVARSLPHKVIRSIAGNGQCLPLCGILLSSTLLALRSVPYPGFILGSHPVLGEDVPDEQTPDRDGTTAPVEMVASMV